MTMPAAKPKKSAPAKSQSNPKNVALAAVAVIAIVGSAVGVFMYLRPEPPPDPSTNVTTGATEEEKQEFQQQKELREKLEKKIAPAGA
jgi:hypothetical protein